MTDSADQLFLDSAKTWRSTVADSRATASTQVAMLENSLERARKTLTSYEELLAEIDRRIPGLSDG